MNFTREPIIETIISAKDGHKLSIRSSKNTGSEEYLVDAVEVVSFGGTFFYRSQERVKAFFLPSSDYEIQEVKETRVLIKNPTLEKSVKIAGGKEASIGGKAPAAENTQTSPPAQTQEEEGAIKNPEQKREKKRYRKNRRPSSDTASMPTSAVDLSESSPSSPPPAPALPQPGMFSHLLKPPERLISDTLGKYRQRDDRTPTVPVEEKSSAELKEPSLQEAVEEPLFGEDSLKEERPKRHTMVHPHKDDHPRGRHKKENVVEDVELVSEAPQKGEILEEGEQLIPTSILSMPTHRERITPDMIDEVERSPLDHQE